jgi:cytochrome-b5 reductase
MLSAAAQRLSAGWRIAAAGGAAAAAALAAAAPARAAAAAPPAMMTPADWTPLTLLAREQLTGGDRPTLLLRFALPAGQPPLPVTSALLVRLPVGEVKEDGTRKMVMKPYTPISAPDAPTLDLAVKIYAAGALTPHLAALKPGATLDFKGPLPKVPADAVAAKKAVGLVAGGTGLTPMLQLATELLRREGGPTVTLVYANVSPADIMLKARVDALAAAHPRRFRVHYLVDKAAPGWAGGVGFVSRAVLAAHMPPPGPDAFVAVCGPPGMMKAIGGEKASPQDQGELSGLLKEMGYAATGVYKF